MTTDNVTIIMRSKNSDWVIDQALASLFSQSFKDFQLIVVDSGSTDNTLNIIKQYPCKLVEIQSNHYYPGAVLNNVINDVDTEVIVFQNSDAVLLTPHSLEHLLDGLKGTTTVASFARQIPRPEAEPWVRADYAKSFPDREASPSWITLSLPFAAMKKSAWDQHNFYSDAWASEDTEWGNWAQNYGHNIQYAYNSLVMHSHNYTLSQIYGRKFVEGEADAFIYRNRISIAQLIKSFVSSTLKDLVAYFTQRNYAAIITIPTRRLVYNWAYYKGHRHGENRLKTNDANAETGQRKVLSRYDS